MRVRNGATYRLSDSVSLLWLNLQKDFQSVSTRGNWRLTITSKMACRGSQTHSFTKRFRR